MDKTLKWRPSERVRSARDQCSTTRATFYCTEQG